AISSLKPPDVLSLIAPNIKRAIGDKIHKKAAYAIVLAVLDFTERKAFASSIETRFNDGISLDELICSACSISSLSNNLYLLRIVRKGVSFYQGQEQIVLPPILKQIVVLHSFVR